ncbi:hypothetical protein HUN08_15520 [Gordonia sp. X0973]|uniref:hypothetical protein n=1 Tax=Gordonia sp. X0973 TaxID=2742602 RepID=UPI000F539F84|nr:hypothetical protein [Gordonia sp. X0973]QKT08445.1 hypothetical protein HUN08_15520 [Gordonia sp. X0973]
MTLLSQSAFTSGLVKSALAVAIGAAVVATGTACGSGQVSQTATQAPAINGAVVRDGNLTLNDVQVIYPTATDSTAVFAAGGPYKLAFVISNDDPVNNTKLVSITAPTGTVALDGDTTVPAGLALRAGEPAGMTPTEGQKFLSATLSNAGQTVSPGLTVPLTFNFNTNGKATSVKVDTPVDAGALMERKDKDPSDSAETEH